MRNQSIYVMETESGLVKIGVSCNPEVRTKSIATQSGFKITKEFHTKKCSNALDLEKQLHAFFKEYRVFGEWFKVDFGTVVNKVKLLFDEKTKAKQMKVEMVFCFCSTPCITAVTLLGRLRTYVPKWRKIW